MKTRHPIERSPWALLVWFVLISQVGGCGRMPEASFELATDSRLPSWFSVPDGYSRSDASVRVHYFLRSRGREADFELFVKGKKFKAVTGELYT